MRQFNKKTIALVLASVVTVVGAFGAENYKNSLMSLKFDAGSGGTVSVTLLTKRNYEQTITPIKKDATTYVIMLPETNSQMPSSPELAGDVESVNVRTMPYTTSGKGYTKVTIKTSQNTMLTAQNALYIPENKQIETLPERKEMKRVVEPAVEKTTPIYRENNDSGGNKPNPSQMQSIHSRSGVDQTNPVDIQKSMQQFETNTDGGAVSNYSISNNQINNRESDSSSETLLLILGVIFVIITSIFFVIKAKNKMAEVIGEQPNFSEEKENKKQNEKISKRKQIKNTIRKLDKMYSKPAKISVSDIHDTVFQAEKMVKSTEELKVESENVVDLDELFKEKIKPQENLSNDLENEEENSALDDFLSGFSFTEENFLQDSLKVNKNEEPKESFNEDLYNKLINDKNLRFSKDDIEKMEKLLTSEINDETMRNLDKFIVTNPIEKKPSKRELLENFVTTYMISQNISFSNADVDALNNLMSVELDNDFITDLRTNPNRVDEMRQEIEKRKSKPHKSSELLTLNVKDMLPDLSEALKQQGGRRIESEAKPQVVYYSEGYDVSTLSLKDELPDLSVEINNDAAYESRPSDEIALAETGYDVEKMSISEDLPNLEDVLNNPDKYKEKETYAEVDEDALLKNIVNVSFKPIYDDVAPDNFDDSNAPTVSDMQEEFNQFDGSFEIVNDTEDSMESAISNEKEVVDDFESLYDGAYVDFDKKLTDVTDLNDKQVLDKSSKISDNANQLIQLIETKKAEKKLEKINTEQTESEEKSKKQIEVKEEDLGKMVIENEIFDIISQYHFTKNLCCYLVKNECGYRVIGSVGNKILNLKNYDKLKTEKLQIRASEHLDDGTIRYIVRVGANKFILEINRNEMKYVMDLC